MKNWYAETEYESHWKNDLQTALENAQNKFVKYYKQTENVKEKLYVIVTVLDSYLQMNVYKSENWESAEWMTYWAQIIWFYQPHYMQHESSICIQAAQASEVEITILDNKFWNNSLIFAESECNSWNHKHLSCWLNCEHSKQNEMISWQKQNSVSQIRDFRMLTISWILIFYSDINDKEYSCNIICWSWS